MARPVTLFTIQWGDLPLEEICALAQKMGYEGLELSAAHLDMKRAASDPAYVQEVKDTLARYGLGCWSTATIWRASACATPCRVPMTPAWMALHPRSWPESLRPFRPGPSRR